MNISKPAKFYLTSQLLLLFGLLATSQVIAQDGNVYLEHLDKWSNVLTKFVDEEGRTDFTTLAQDSSDLETFVAAIEQVSPSSHPEFFDTPSQVLAYHANAYNALAMWGIIDRGIPDNLSSFFKRASFFKLRKVTIGGEKTDLYNYENKVIRPLGEERMHFALNCMVIDCPRLPRKPFYADSLEQDLQIAAVEFFTKQKHTQVDHEEKELLLSGIMKFYTEDYVDSGKTQDLLGYVNQFREDKVPEDYRVKYLKYDWTINHQ